MARAFFSDGDPHEIDQRDPMASVPANAPRGMVASSEKLSLKRGPDRVEKRPVSDWQNAAWQYYDVIPQIHFAFSLIGSVMSRVRLYAAVIEEEDQPPISVGDYSKMLAEEAGKTPPESTAALNDAEELMNDFTKRAKGGVSGMMRDMGMNTSIPGEFYLLAFEEKWIIASIDEIQQRGDTMYYIPRRHRTTGDAASREKILPEGTFCARIWRSHPRYGSEPDSSMLGVIDDCEQLVLLKQALRTITRSKMWAGAITVTEGLASFASDPEHPDETVEEALARAAVTSVEDESSKETVSPSVITIPVGGEVKYIPMGRQIDEPFLNLMDETLQTVLQGLDIPKDIVTGLADVKYSNAIIVDETLYRAHVEPLVLLIVDALTTVYLRPMLHKRYRARHAGMTTTSDFIDRIVVWADTSEIVTRPDKSQAANEGFDRKILSAKAWRDARGFNEADAPDDEETLKRLALDRAIISPQISDEIIKLLAPEFFKDKRAQASELPGDLEAILDPDAERPGPKTLEPDLAVPDDLSGLDTALSGGEVNPHGNLPNAMRPDPVRRPS